MTKVSPRADAPYGVLGRTLGHSYTPRIYPMLADIEYVRFEREPEEVEAFLRGDEWSGVNVTIPYKRTVVPYLDELTACAKRLGNVNTIVRLPDGRLRGGNTDYFGFKTLVESTGVDVTGKRALVLGGSGGAGTTCMTVLEDLGCEPIAVGRSGAVTYDDLDAYAAVHLIVNATPVGMYPACPDSPVDLTRFKGLEAVVDIVYNPARTGLMLQAEELGVPSAGGLLMLVAQAAEAVRAYTGDEVARERILEVTSALSQAEQNIALIGMPGSGKTRVGQALARLLDREHVDLDDAFRERIGMSCAEFITIQGEEAFRTRETQVLSEVAKRSGLVISCGGGVVTRDENYPLLHQNSRIVMLNRPIGELSRKGRPITARDGVEKLAAERMPRYRAWADIVIDSRENAEATARVLLPSLA